LSTIVFDSANIASLNSGYKLSLYSNSVKALIKTTIGSIWGLNRVQTKCHIIIICFALFNAIKGYLGFL
jgi:hypothetical protein